MNIKHQIYLIRKRINDRDLLKIKVMIDEEIERRQLAEDQSKAGVKT